MAALTPARPAPSRGWRRPAILLGAILCTASLPKLHAQQDTSQPLLDKAAQLRAELEAKPKQQRTRSEYESAIEAYRAASHHGEDPAEAAEAVSAAAGLLAEEGRLFRSETTLLNAVGQYELLRQRFPQSDFCTGALLHEGEIYWRDLHDRNAANTAFAEFLRQYPASQFASQVRANLRQIGREGGDLIPASRSSIAANLSRTPMPRRSVTTPGSAQPHNGSRPLTASGRHLTTQVVEDGPEGDEPTPEPSRIANAAPLPVSGSVPGPASGRTCLVTGVRHWSTPVYTRVAIDMQDQVQYEAVRVPNPDRIYFDLHGAKIAAPLIGRSVDVTDGGFLKRIRIAQFSDDVTRVVLDVSQVSEYSAFFLPNPWRLIIDVHGSKSPANGPDDIAALAPTAHPGSAPPSLPAARGKAQNATVADEPPGRSSIGDIAALGTQPNRVKATRRPTTGPIAASVAGTTQAAQSSREIALAPGAATASVATHNGEAVMPPLAAETSTGAGRGQTGKTLFASPGLSLSAPPAHTRNRKAGSDIAPTTSADEPPSFPAHEAEPSADGQRSLVRALGLKIGRIVIDAGHGGHDSGTIGPEGMEEKDVVLDVALRLGKLLKQRLGADVIYTRNTDTFIPLETRTAVANKAQADLFLSIHANSSPDPEARGVETYYLNFTTSPDALEVAARENAVSDESIHELSGLVKKITLKDKIDESREFAADVQTSLYTGLESGNAGLRDRGVKKAPFVVLIGANMPSILAEISFLTNPHDAFSMRNPEYRERIAESLYAGVARYIRGLSGVRLARATQ